MRALKSKGRLALSCANRSACSRGDVFASAPVKGRRLATLGLTIGRGALLSAVWATAVVANAVASTDEAATKNRDR